MMVLAAFSALTSFVTQGIPQITEFSSIIQKYNSKPRYALRILRDATELEITGPLDFGISSAVSTLLENHPSIHTLHLNSEGGRLAEADVLRKLVMQRGLNTYVATQCASACVTVFVAGKNRWLSRGAEIGLHSPYFPGSSDEEFAATA
jgi:ATP-dependent protease ClpP protease subunit